MTESTMTLNASRILLFFGAVDSPLAVLTTANNQPANSCNRLHLVLTSCVAHFRPSPSAHSACSGNTFDFLAFLRTSDEMLGLLRHKELALLAKSDGHDR